MKRSCYFVALNNDVEVAAIFARDFNEAEEYFNDMSVYYNEIINVSEQLSDIGE